MDSSNREESDITQELRQLGANLSGTLRSAWESEDRKKFQHEIEAGLQGLGEEIRKAGDEIDVKGISEEVRTGVEGATQKIQSGEVGDRMRSELLSVLQTINAQLQDVQSKWTPGGGDEEAEE
ncbi:MAG: hypothetical protein R3335_08890 [Anaerolineales bacterium]|nr:hypothetical protein [Anaerolineales bacterium]